MRNTLPATQWPSGIKYMIMPIAGVFILYFAMIKLFNLDRYRHHQIEGAGQGMGKTDQQILEEIQVAHKAKRAKGGGKAGKAPRLQEARKVQKAQEVRNGGAGNVQ